MAPPIAHSEPYPTSIHKNTSTTMTMSSSPLRAPSSSTSSSSTSYVPRSSASSSSAFTDWCDDSSSSSQNSLTSMWTAANTTQYSAQASSLSSSSGKRASLYSSSPSNFLRRQVTPPADLKQDMTTTASHDLTNNNNVTTTAANTASQDLVSPSNSQEKPERRISGNSTLSSSSISDCSRPLSPATSTSISLHDSSAPPATPKLLSSDRVLKSILKPSPHSLSPSPSSGNRATSFKDTVAALAQRFSFKGRNFKNSSEQSTTAPAATTTTTPTRRTSSLSPFPMSDVPTLSPKPSKRGVKITRSNSVPSPVSDRLKKRLSAPSMATSVPVTTTVTAQPVTKSPSTIHHVTFDPRPPASCTVESHWLRVTQHDQLTCDGDSSSSSATTLSASSDNMDDDDQDDDDDETDPGWPSLTCTSPHISRALSASNKKWYSDEWLDYWREGDDVERVERRVAIFEYPFGPPPYETESRRTTQPKVGPSPLSTSFEASPCRGTTSAMSCAVQNGGMFFPSFMGVGVPALKFSTD